MKSLLAELEELRRQLHEANETIEAIRTGQVDAFVVDGDSGSQLYTLKSADHAYRVFIENMNEGAITLSEDGIILYANSRFAQMVRSQLSDVIGLPFDHFIKYNFLERYQAILDQCWKHDCKGEVELGNDGYYIPVQLSLTALHFDGENSVSMIITDLTFQKNTQQHLEENNRQLEISNYDLQQFAYIASHDLQEPLRKILIFANLMKDRCLIQLNQPGVNYLEKILTSADRMKTLIIGILNYSRLSANDGRFMPTDLNKLLLEVIEDFELTIQEKNAIITVSELPVIEINDGQIRQVFHNLISNSLKFSKKDEVPVIRITSKLLERKSLESPEQVNGPFCLLIIEDNGVGFDEKYLDNVFSLFERLHSKDQYEGTGIGLAIAKKIIEKHNGIIHAKSTMGNGAQFMILLPIAQLQQD